MRHRLALFAGISVLLAYWTMASDEPLSVPRYHGIPTAEGNFTGSDGTRLFYRISGVSGKPPVLFLHGGPGLGLDDGGYDIEPLAEMGYHLFMFNQRGAGRSEIIKEPNRLRMDDFVDDVEVFRKFARIDHFAVIGLSWGGGVALRYAEKYPGHVTRVVFLSPMSPTIQFQRERDKHLDLLKAEPEKEKQADARRRIETATDAEIPELCHQMFDSTDRLYIIDVRHLEGRRSNFCRLPAEGLRNFPTVVHYGFESLGEWDFRPLMKKLFVPSLVIEGAETNVPLDGTREWAKNVPNSRLLLIKNAGHQTWVDQPRALVVAIDEFLQGKWPSDSVALVTLTQKPATFPGATWTKVAPHQSGWSSEKLDEARKYFDTLPPASLLVVDKGKLIVEWGDSTTKIKISSMRKSILSALYGIYLKKSKFNLDKTIGQLGIDDDPPLNATEKQATVRMLLQARSGVYHSYVAGTPAMRATMPQRGSHAPGTFWYYNNWDFNVLGTIFERVFRTKIGEAFRDKIAGPTQMQDFQLSDMYYLRGRSGSPEYEQSEHPAYHFRMSARDLARFGYLMLRGGNWNGIQIIPSTWVEESTRSYSEAEGGGYGYLWWINGLELPAKSFSAQGALAKYVVVIPDRDLVVVYLNHAEFPDNASAVPAATLNALPTISKDQISHLVKLLMEAQQHDTSVTKD